MKYEKLLQKTNGFLFMNLYAPDTFAINKNTMINSSYSVFANHLPTITRAATILAAFDDGRGTRNLIAGHYYLMKGEYHKVEFVELNAHSACRRKDC
jgi:hypothetical protein